MPKTNNASSSTNVEGSVKQEFEDDYGSVRSGVSGDEALSTPQGTSRSNRSRRSFRVGKPRDSIPDELIAEAAAMASSSKSELARVRPMSSLDSDDDEGDYSTVDVDVGRASGRGQRSTSKARRDSSSGMTARRVPTTTLSSTNPKLPSSRVAQSEAVREAVFRAAQLTPIQAEDDFEEDDDVDMSAVRKQRNKFSASQYRKRRKVFVELLEEKVAELECQLKEMQKHAQTLEIENKQLQILQRVAAPREFVPNNMMHMGAHPSYVTNSYQSLSAHPNFPLNLAHTNQQVLSSRSVPHVIDYNAQAQPSPVDMTRVQAQHQSMIHAHHFQNTAKMQSVQQTVESVPSTAPLSTSVSVPSSSSTSMSSSGSSSPFLMKSNQKQDDANDSRNLIQVPIELVNIERSASVTAMEPPPSALSMLTISPLMAPTQNGVIQEGLSRSSSQASHSSHSVNDGSSKQSDSPSMSSIASGMTSVFSTKTEGSELPMASSVLPDPSSQYRYDAMTMPAYVPVLSNYDGIDSHILDPKVEGLLPMQRQVSNFPLQMSYPTQYAHGVGYSTNTVHFGIPSYHSAHHLSVPSKVEYGGNASRFTQPQYLPLNQTEDGQGHGLKPLNTFVEPGTHVSTSTTSSPKSGDDSPPPPASYGLVMFCMFACLMMVAVPASEWALATGLGVSSVTMALLDTNMPSSYPTTTSSSANVSSQSNAIRVTSPTGYGRVLLSFDPRQPVSTWSYRQSDVDDGILNIVQQTSSTSQADISSIIGEITKGKPNEMSKETFMFELLKRLFWTHFESTLQRSLRALQLGAALSFAILNTLFGQICMGLSVLALLYSLIKFVTTRVTPIARYILQPPNVDPIVKQKAL